MPAARASLPPRPRASSTLWICGAAHTANVTALCVENIFFLPTSHALVPPACMHKAGGVPRTCCCRKKGARACWPSGISRSSSELPGRMGAAGPACTASPTPRCCGASMYANPRLSPPAPAHTASVTPAEWHAHYAPCARLRLHWCILQAKLGCKGCRRYWRTHRVAHERDTRAAVGVVLKPLYNAGALHRGALEVHLPMPMRSIACLKARHVSVHTL